MEIVELKVQVDKSQLLALEAEVQKLQGTTINFKTGTGGSGGVSSDPTAGVRNGLKQTQAQAERTGQSILSVVGKVAKWTAVTAAVYAPIHAFKEAINTLKEVDSQLVQVQKVTDFSAKQMKDIEQQAYKTASAYGVSADKYLESVSAFARAGYKEQSEQLAELSVKTQLVGDTTAEVANQFLLSTDAAYQYQGNIEKLTSILDGANELDNKYATSIEKIAEGMGLVAPVAAQAHVGVDELMASIGTITAVTQRSGSETARALRALFLNIMGDTKTEIDEGVTWTTGEIAGLQDVLRKFAPDVVKAAEATKSVINPMEAMNALAKAMKEGALTEQDLMEMVSDIGGKLRSSQLLALIQNWDMYESMLSDFQNAVGSADREIENAMNSWERKTEVLKNTWTEFVSHMVDTDMIKGGLDAITNVVETLDSDFGRAALSAGALGLAFSGIVKALPKITGSKAITGLTKLFGTVKAEGLAAGIAKIATAMGPLGIALAGIAAIVATPAIVDFFTTDYEEQGEKVSKLKDEYKELYDVQGEYQTLLEKRGSKGGLTEWEQSRFDYLENYRKELNEAIEEEKRLAAEKYQEQYGHMDQSSLDEDYYRNGGRGRGQGETIDVVNLRNAKKAFEELNEAASSGQKSQKEYQEGIDEILASYKDWYEATKQGLDEGWLDTSDLTQAQQDLMELYETMQKLRDVPLDKLNVATAIESFKGLTEYGDKSVVNWQKLSKAMREAGASSEEIETTLASMKQDDNIVLIDVEAENAEETLQQLQDIGLAVETADGMEINIDGLTTLLSDIGMSRDQIVDLVAKLGEINGVSFVDAEGNMANLATATANAGSAVANVIDGIKKKADELGQTKPVVQMTAKDGVSKVADAASKAVRSIPTSWSVTLTANAGPVLAAVNTAKAAISTFNAFKAAVGAATGADNWRGGPVLLGDELSPDGSPRPELVITKGGKAFLAGLAGPTMANLPAGSRVYPYSDTAGILSGRDMAEIQAFGAGNDRILQHYLNPTTAGATSGDSASASSASSSSSGGSKSGSISGSKSRTKSGSKGGSKGSSSGTSETDDYLEQLKKELDLLRAQYDYLEASGAATDDLIGKSKEIQDKLHEVNERLRETGGEEKEIVENSTDWYEELEKIHDVQKELYEKERNLLETQVSLMEKQGRSASERISKLKEIQDNLHREAEFLRSIKADQAEINELSAEWWETQSDILDIQNELWEELDAAVNGELKKARDARDDEIEALDKELERIQAARDAKQDQLDLEEKLKKVEEARFALENAQNERTVRYFNASKGQWEWAADASKVKSARESLEQAQKDLKDYQDELAYQATVDAINRRKDAINSAYDALEAGWEKITESIQEPGRDIALILDDIAKNGTPRMKEQVETTGQLLSDLNNYIRSAVGNTTGDSYTGGGGTASKNYATDKTDYSALMDRASDEAEFQYWADQRTAKALAQGIDIAANGWRSNSEIYDNWKNKQASDKSYAEPKTEASLTKNKSVKLTAESVAEAIKNKVKSTAKKYDNGGVLTGMGGIKATSADEIVIPPSLAGFMLEPSADGRFQQRMAELGYLYGDETEIPPTVETAMQSRTSNDHYGDVYQYGNITLSEGQAKSMTVYELAQKSRVLSVYAAVQ